MSEKEILNDFRENYERVRNLLDEESKTDPENEPYKSSYKARDILKRMQETLTSLNEAAVNIDPTKVQAMLGTVLVNIGIINMETEELAASENILMEAESLLTANALLPEIIIPILNVYNNLGILWSNRQDPEKAKGFLIKAKECYENFKCTLLMPLPIEHVTSSKEENPVNCMMQLEKAHTLTLYYLAQVFGALKQSLKSAMYCHATLRRQLQYSDYEPIDWALNCATLSQFFAEQNGFFQSRHHLAAASTILEKYENELLASVSEDEIYLAKLEIFNHRSADIARCWAKYCIMLLTNSKQRLMSDGDSDQHPDTATDMSNLKIEDEENICSGDIRSIVFSNLDVSKYESKVGDKYLLTFSDAREAFLSCQHWLNQAKEYYKFDTHASDYIELVQDSSQAYSYLSFFEEDDERRAKMHKRRINMLEELLEKINPTYYLRYCRQLWYELGEIYSDILTIKLDKFRRDNEKPTPHVLNKINLLCVKSIENYDHFLNSVKNKDGVYPQPLEPDHIAPVICALAHIGRNSMKRIALDKRAQLEHVRKSFDSYQTVVDICSKDEAAAHAMSEEYSLCKDMVAVLCIKLRKLEHEVMSM